MRVSGTLYWASTICASLIILGACSARNADESRTVRLITADWKEALYTAPDYDEARDPAADLAVTIARASAENKTILLEVGGEWCSWCQLLDDYIAGTPTVQDALLDGFIIQKVNYSKSNENSEFLSQFPPAEGYPYLIVLAPDGALLAGQETGSLEKGRGYDTKKVLAFLSEWAPSK